MALRKAFICYKYYFFYGSDVNSASSLLGHSSLAYTQRYLRVVNELKEKAVQNLPDLKL